jgi:sec-independent protein translocase protein TatB
MFDIGFWELVLISVVALVVLGPERLPYAIRYVARFMASARQMANSVKEELSQELKLKELEDNLRKAEKMNLRNLSSELQSSSDRTTEVSPAHADAESSPETSLVEASSVPVVSPEKEVDGALSAEQQVTAEKQSAEKQSGQ